MLPLTTSRLLVCPCRLPLITAIYLQDPQAVTLLNADIPPEWPMSELKELLPHLIELLQHDPKSFPWLLWAIVSATDKTVLGNIGFKGRPDENGMVEIGYSLLPPYRKQGYMQEAATALITWAFQQPFVKSIEAECAVDNSASRKVLQRLGMRQTGMQDNMLRWQLLEKDFLL
ncbi:GNAT family N-acetyltransferase [Chitinophaga oryzae]|uniref:GNAT family N-acetyltransferase n=1 Tax=Chitinophaga oryzae TaxID=2725414 RepID=A0AAE7D9W7_9BACT|nr:GNAT family N-acetyltransferase [Chitinophaga oryzae]QJB34275.1 GNAT family N-acetyltransferase [Chitinophaga oryzae]QJB40796.1 GNAT family N-acetyltransferase [Chitinophaga oryzae]